MKNSVSCLLLSLLLWGCTQMEQDGLSRSGEVRFTAVTLGPFSGNIPHARTEAESDWKHIFKDRAKLEVTDKNTGQTYELIYSPNDLGEGFTLSLPYGSYTYFSEVAGGKFRRYLPFRIEGEFILNAESLDLTLNATTDYGLITVKNENLSSVKISHGPESYGMGLLEDGSHYFIYVRNGLNTLLEIHETLENKVISRQVAVQMYNHYHFILKLPPTDGTVNFIELALGEFELVKEGIGIGEVETGTFVDARDGQVYRTVRIMEQTWMGENLNYETSGSWCYDNDPANCDKYGRLYEWDAALAACPDGWHLPSRAEWEVLANYLGGREVAGGKMKATTDWDRPNTGATNESGFSALPGGIASSPTKNLKRLNFRLIGRYGYWWTSDREWEEYFGRYSIRLIHLSENSEDVSDNIGISLGDGVSAYSCRCLKD